jgi:hypothetical protein
MKSIVASLFLLGAVVAITFPNVVMANREGCVAQCRSAHNQCRIAAKAVSSPQCDAQLQACLERCSRSR